MSKEYRGRGIHNNDAFWNRVKSVISYIVNYDAELDVQIRENYINIYYKGGNICKIKGKDSIIFDPFYFYQDPLYDKNNVRRKSTDLIRGNNKKNIPRDEIRYNEFKNKARSITQLLKFGNYKEYFGAAKVEMNKYWQALNLTEGERKDQQQICLMNRQLSNDYIVIDVEYQVSDNSDFKYKGRLGNKKPRFDIIAIDSQSGQLVVIELKTGTKALYNPSGLDDHYECYKGSIEKNDSQFMNEMNFLLKQKQELGLLPMSLRIKSKSPKLVFAFTYSQKESKSEQEQKAEFEKEAQRVDASIQRIVLNSKSFVLCK